MQCPRCEKLLSAYRKAHEATIVAASHIGVDPHHLREKALRLLDDADAAIRELAGPNTYGVIATTPSDDGEPISRQWVAEHFGDKYGRIEIGPHRIFVRSTPGEVDINCHDEPLTRGQLRQLLAALGWRGEERG